jgi:threonyl-tRNA synthetase
MKMLILHCREFGFELNKKGKLAEEPAVGSAIMENCVVAMVCVEKGDSFEKVPLAAKEIASIADSVSSKSVVVFPFAHLSNELAEPAAAKGILRGIYDALPQYSRAWVPFGWFKIWRLESMGHSLASNFRSI